MNNHPIQYGPSLRRIAERYFPGSNPAESSAVDVALVMGRVDAAHKSRLWDMSNHVRAVARSAEPSAVVAGDIVSFKDFNAAGKHGLEPLSLGSETPFLLDSPCPQLGPHAWHAWVASGYTAYATNWDVFVPWDEPQWPYDPEACVVHANRRAIVHLDMATSISVRVSPTCLAGVRAVSDEFLAAALSGEVPSSAVKVDERGERLTLGGLKVRTGRVLDDEGDPRLVFSQMLLTLATELTDFAYAWASATQPRRNLDVTGAISRAAETVVVAIGNARRVVEFGLAQIKPGELLQSRLANASPDFYWADSAGHRQTLYFDKDLGRSNTNVGCIALQIVQKTRTARIPEKGSFKLMTVVRLTSDLPSRFELGISVNALEPRDWILAIPGDSIEVAETICANDQVSYCLRKIEE